MEGATGGKARPVLEGVWPGRNLFKIILRGGRCGSTGVESGKTVAACQRLRGVPVGEPGPPRKIFNKERLDKYGKTFGAIK